MLNNNISVVMSTYNEPEEWLRKSIESILNQTYSNLEFIIVCDNPQNKDLINLLDSYEKKDNRIKIIVNEINIGLSKSLNVALNECKGKYVARMDADDIAIKNRFELQMKYLIDNKLDLVGSGVVCIDENEKEISTLNSFPKNNEVLRKKVIYNNCIAHPTWLGKSELFKTLKGYRDIPYAEDYDFVLRALSKGYKLGNIQSVLLKYRIRSSSISNKNGLKQFLVSKVITSLYTKNDLCKDTAEVLDNINTKLKSINEDDEKEYYVASQLFTEAAFKLQKFNLTGSVDLVKAMTKSKYYRGKIFCYIKGIL